MIWAIDEGSNESDRMIASPRKMCVPGVQANAAEGVAAIARIAMHTTQMTATTGCPRDSLWVNLDTDALPLTPHGFAEVVHFGADDVIDCFLRAVDILAHAVGDIIHRD